MKLKSAIVAGLILLVGAVGTANAGTIVSIVQVGPNVVLSYSAGTLNTTGLSTGGNFTGCGKLWTDSSMVGGGPSPFCTFFFGGISVSSSSGWTTGNSATDWSSTTGSGGLFGRPSLEVGALPFIVIGYDTVPAFVGVNTINGATGTVLGVTLASLGLTANQSITFSWATDSLTFTTGPVSTAAVPEPATLLLLGTGIAAIAARRRFTART